jgi:hypothetical protein
VNAQHLRMAILIVRRSSEQRKAHRYRMRQRDDTVTISSSDGLSRRREQGLEGQRSSVQWPALDKTAGGQFELPA